MRSRILEIRNIIYRHPQRVLCGAVLGVTVVLGIAFIQFVFVYEGFEPHFLIAPISVGGISGTIICLYILLVRQREKDLLVALKEARQANETKTQFLANMSHELRTPLNAIIGFSQLIATEAENQKRTEKTAEYAGCIEEAGAQLHSIVSDLLESSALEFGRYELNISEFDFHDALAETLRALDSPRTKKRHKIQSNLTENPTTVVADYPKITHVISNILSNAIKYTEPDGEITIVTRAPAAGGVELVVRDNGQGIAASELPTIFDPFQIGRDAYSRQHGGTGLGLSIVKAFTDLHSGTVSIESELGKGTSVTLTLPSAPDARTGVGTRTRDA